MQKITSRRFEIIAAATNEGEDVYCGCNRRKLRHRQSTKVETFTAAVKHLSKPKSGRCLIIFDFKAKEWETPLMPTEASPLDEHFHMAILAAYARPSKYEIIKDICLGDAINQLVNLTQ